MSEGGPKKSFWVLLVLIILGLGGFGVYKMTKPEGGAGKDDTKKEEAQPKGAPAAPTPAPTPAPQSNPATSAVNRVLNAGLLTVGMDTGVPPGAGSPPMYFRTGTEDDGFDMRVAEWVASGIGIKGNKVRIVHGDYDKLPEMLTKGQVDVIISGFTPDEIEGVAWSEPYLNWGLCLIVKKNSPIKNVGMLAGKMIAIYTDDVAEAEVKRLAPNYKGITKMKQGYFDDLASGAVDAFIYDYPFAVAEIRDWYAKNPGKAGMFQIVQYNLNDATYAVGVRASESDLLGLVNRGLSIYKNSPAYTADLKKYMASGQQAEAVNGKKYVVKAGDTLSTIAQKELGSSDAWKKIWDLNRNRFPNPNFIEPGDQLAMP